MSIWDDLLGTANDILHGQLGKAVGDVGRTVHDVVGGGGSPTGGVSASTSIPSFGKPWGGMLPPGDIGGFISTPTGLVPVKGVGTPACCDRFRLDSGFLVDGVTGVVWKYDDRSKSFEEVAVHREKSKQALVDTLVETKFSSLRSQYEQQVLATTPPADRAKLLATFEKEQLEPMREAAKATQY